MTNRGTILYIGGFELPDKNAAAHRVLNNARIFVELGYKVVFCGVDRNINESAKTAIHFEGFESWPSKYPTSTKEWIKEQFFRYTENILNNYDDVRYVIGYNMHMLPLKKLEKWCKKNKVKIFVDTTEWYPNKFSFKPGKFIRWFDTNCTMRIYQKKVDGVIAISSLLERYYNKHVKKTVIIPPLVDTNEKKWKQDYDYSQKVEFIYSGNAGKGRDIVKDKIDVVINAMLIIPENIMFHFSIIGMTKKDCLVMFPELTDKLEFLKDKIDFYGNMKHEECIKKLLSSDYCIFLRNRNRQNMAGFPTKFTECITCGIGIIVNEFSDISQYFPRDNCYLLNDIKYQTVADAIQNAIRKGKVEHSIDNTFHYSKYIDRMKCFLND